MVFFYGVFTDESDRFVRISFSDLLNLLIQTVLSTLIVLMTAEFYQKYFQIYANGLIKFFALPAYIFYLLFYFISSFLISVSDFVLKKFFRTDGDQIQLYFSKVELGITLRSK
jgi:CBS domain containing-hemolysin-like protein